MKILAIETSCDDTSVALVSDEPKVLSLRVVGQKQLHQRFGGVVPENASRAHLEVLDPTVEDVLKEAACTLQDIDAFAVTHAPGLVGSLLVGVCYAKTLARALQKPCYGIHHLEGHLAAPMLAHQSDKLLKLPSDPSKGPRSSAPASELFPALALVVSGGHTAIYLLQKWGDFKLLGQTRDDAVGECFDKCARVMGFGFPGGPELNQAAEAYLKESGEGGQIKRPARFELPRPHPGVRWTDNCDFSFSGLKTAVRVLVESQPEILSKQRGELALAIHEAVGETVLKKLDVAFSQCGSVNSLWFTGGVACNTLLRKWLNEWCVTHHKQFLVAPPVLCTDNAAMIGYAGILRAQEGLSPQPFEVCATLGISSFHA